MKKKFDIMNHVELSDQIMTIVTQPMPGNFSITFQPYDKTKQVVIDEKAKQVMDEKITEKSSGRNARDPNTVEYIKEYATKLLSELFRVELASLEEIKDAPQDPYAEIKKKFTR